MAKRSDRSRNAPSALAFTIAMAAAAPVLASPLGSAPIPRAAAPSSIAGYVGYVNAVAMDVDTAGVRHVIWSGQRADEEDFLVYYSRSSDGTTWTTPELLNTTSGLTVDIAVDQSNDRVHLVYNGLDEGIHHRTITAGVLSAPTLSFPGPTPRVSLAAPASGGPPHVLFARWTDRTFQEVSSFHARWEGDAWSAPAVPFGGPGTVWQSLAVSSAGAVMVGGIDGDFARSSLAVDGLAFAPAVQVNTFYTVFEHDSTATVGFSDWSDGFRLLTDHFLFPGDSDIHVRAWDDDQWSEPVNVSASTTPTRSAREALHSASGVGCEWVSWLEIGSMDATLLVRQISPPITNFPYDLGQPFKQDGVPINTNNRHDTVLTPDGTLHVILGESRYDQNAGLWYLEVEPPCSPAFFSDGFEGDPLGL